MTLKTETESEIKTVLNQLYIFWTPAELYHATIMWMETSNHVPFVR